VGATAVVSEKGQVTLPKALRDRLGIVPGTRIAFDLDAEGTLRVRVMRTGAASLAGLLARPGEPARSLREMDDAIGAVVRERSGHAR
jgi:AbrB family looped-hinge helix DNA binding protein